MVGAELKDGLNVGSVAWEYANGFEFIVMLFWVKL